MLFLTERQAFADALRGLTEGLTQVIEVPAVVRPRERRPRSLRMLGRSLPNDTRHCWFLMAAGGPEAPGEAADDRTHDHSGR